MRYFLEECDASYSNCMLYIRDDGFFIRTWDAHDYMPISGQLSHMYKNLETGKLTFAKYDGCPAEYNLYGLFEIDTVIDLRSRRTLDDVIHTILEECGYDYVLKFSKPSYYRKLSEPTLYIIDKCLCTTI